MTVPSGPHDPRVVAIPWLPLLLAAVVVVVAVVLSLASTAPEIDAERAPFVVGLDEPGSRAEERLVRGDGQFFWMLSQDPTLSRTDGDRRGPAEYAYRAQRPLLGYLAWFGSLGVSGWAAWALYAWSAVGALVLVAGVAAFATVAGRRADPAHFAVLLPGSITVLFWTGPEALAAGLAVLAVARGVRSGRADALTCALLAAACLGRETTVLVAAGLALHLWARRRRADAVTAVVVPSMVLAAWYVVVRVRVGFWPWEAGEGRLALPGAGMADVAGDWAALDWVLVAGSFLLVSLAVVRALRERNLDVVWLLVPLTAFATMMGSEVWTRWQDWSRPLLPLMAMGLVLAAFPAARSDPAVTHPG
jgi:hypothetical protein